MSNNFCSTTNFNVLITSISRKVPLIKAVKKAFAKLGNSGKVYGADASVDCVGRFFVSCVYSGLVGGPEARHVVHLPPFVVT